MNEFLVIASLTTALAAFFLSVVTALYTWQKRAENPYTAHIEAEVAELADRLNHFQKRTAARQRRASPDDEPEPVQQPTSQNIEPVASFNERFHAKYGSR